MRLQRREKILIGVLAAAAVIAGLRYLGVGGADFGLLVGQSGGAPAIDEMEVVPLRVGELEASAGEYSVNRNLWSFEHAPPPPRPAPEPVPQPPPRPVETEPRDLQPTPSQPPAPKPPPVDVTYLGSFGPPERRIAVFTDSEDTLYNARVGDVINDKFRVSEIGYESVDLEFVGFPDVPPARLAPGSS